MFKPVMNYASATINPVAVYVAGPRTEINVNEPLMLLPPSFLEFFAATGLDVIADEATGCHYEVVRFAIITKKDGSITPALCVQPMMHEVDVE